MGKEHILAILVTILFISTLTNTQTTSGEISPSQGSPQEEHFFVQHTFWAFGGIYPICSFSAASGDCIILSISSTNSDPNRPNDVYVVDLEITSTNHGMSFVSGARFTQTITLNYSDTYKITADKHQFWSSVTISGEITIHHNPAPLDTNPSPSFPAPTLNPMPSTTSENNSNASMSKAPELPLLQVLLAFIIMFALPNGEHNVKVYAIDRTGNVGVPETVTFTINVFPIGLAVAIGVVLVVLSTGLLAYFLRLKRKRSKA